MRIWEVTNKDASGVGSLSWAILQANAYAEDNPDVEQQIRFIAPEDASPNEDGTSFWRFDLEDPLPPIKSGKLTLNPDGVRPILLAPMLGMVNAGSLLQIGDSEDRIVSKSGDSNNQPIPDVVLRNFHFAHHTASGMSGDSPWPGTPEEVQFPGFGPFPPRTIDITPYTRSNPGRGGALGAGGGITHFYGDIELVESSFQNLAAQGGSGFQKDNDAVFNSNQRGGWIRKADSWLHPNDRFSHNQNLGNPHFNPGWRTSLASFDRHRYQELDVYLKQQPRAFNGRARASDLREPEFYLYHSDGRSMASMDRTARDIDQSVVPDFADSSQPLFGAGGRAGGRGMASGGGSKPHYENANVMESEKWWSNHGQGMHGGSAAPAGFGGGGGGGGGAGAGEHRRLGGDGAPSLRYGTGGEDGGESTTNYRNKATDNQGKDRRDANIGGLTGSGGKGASLGGAIFSYTKDGVIKLDQVDFINVKTIQPDSGVGESAQLGEVIYSNGSDIFMHDVRLDRRVVDPDSLPKADQNFHYYKGSTVEEFEPDSKFINSGGFQEATSVVFNDSISQMRQPVLTGSENIADRFVLNYEQEGSGVRGIRADLTNPNSAFNHIWQQLVPDREDEIRANEPAGLSFSGWMGHLGSDVIGIGTDAMAANSLWDAKYGPVSAGGSFLTSRGFAIGSSVATGIASSTWNYFAGHQNAVEQWNHDLTENARKQDELTQYLEDNHNRLDVGTVNIRENRTIIRVDDFELGVDSLLIPVDGNLDVARNVQITGNLRDANGNRGFRIEYLSDVATSAPQEFARVYLDQKSSEYFQSTDSSADFMMKLLVAPSDSGTGGWVLGTSLTQADVETGESYDGLNSPAGLNVRFDEQQSALRDEDPVRISLGVGNDQYVGSRFSETIYANLGDDVIAPFTGNDVVFAGSGRDMVSYQQLGRSLQIKAVEAPELNSANPNALYVTWLDSSDDDQTIDSFFFGTEIVSLDGINSIDFSGLEPIERREGADYYSVATGSGSDVIGSGSEDIINIQYEIPQHLQTQKDDEPITSDFDPFSEFTSVNAGSGIDTLVTSFESLESSGLLLKSDIQSGFVVSKQNSDQVLLDAQNVEKLVVNSTNQDDSLDLKNLVSANLELLQGSDILELELGKDGSVGSSYVDFGAGDDQGFIQIKDELTGSLVFEFTNSSVEDNNQLWLTDLNAASGGTFNLGDGRDEITLLRSNSLNESLNQTDLTISDFNIESKDQLTLSRDFGNASLSYIVDDNDNILGVDIEGSDYRTIRVDFLNSLTSEDKGLIERHIIVNSDVSI